MFKTLRRLLAIFAVIAMVFGALQSFFQWLARSEDDNHEVFVDDEV